MLNFLAGDKKQKRPIIICATMRSGSTMICEDMRNTGSLGTAKELFMSWRPGKNDHPQRLKKLRKKEATSNGVFSVKVMSKYLPFVEECLQAGKEHENTGTLFPTFAETFNDAVWVYLKREDIVRQAISRYVSSATGVFHNFEDNRHKPSAAILDSSGTDGYTTGLDYNFSMINRSLQNIAREHALWDRFFETNNISPLRLTYEACVDDMASYLNEIAHRAGVPLKGIPSERTIRKLSTNRNKEFHERYCNDLVLKIKQKTFANGKPPQEE